MTEELHFMPQQTSRLTVRAILFILTYIMIETADRPFPKHKRFLPGGTSSWGVMHAFNRTAGGLHLFGPEEKEHFRFLVFGAAHFCGLEVLTWTCLDNHFHLVLNVPSEAEGARLRAEISEEEILERMKKCYSQAYLKETAPPPRPPPGPDHRQRLKGQSPALPGRSTPQPTRPQLSAPPQPPLALLFTGRSHCFQQSSGMIVGSLTQVAQAS